MFSQAKGGSGKSSFILIASALTCSARAFPSEGPAFARLAPPAIVVTYRGQCDAACLSAAAKMRAESERLAEFEVSVEIADEALTESLRLECQAAGCNSACP